MSDPDLRLKIDELQTEIVGLKIRVRRIEDFLQTFAENAEEFGNYLESRPEEDDPLLLEAVKAITTNHATASLIQRKLSVGYARTARIIDQMERKGLIGPADGARPRNVYMDKIKKYIADQELTNI